MSSGRRAAIDSEHAQQSTSTSQQRSLQQACLVAKVADEYRGQDTIVLDLTGITPIVDYFVITHGTSRRQMHAIAEEADRMLQEEGSSRIGAEGYDSNSWILQDYGDIVLHIFTAEARAIYDLEHLWADARKVDWRAELGA
jgi:ribosome-associated protein